MGLASSFLQWIPSTASNEPAIETHSLPLQQWRALSEAKQNRTPFVIYSRSDLSGPSYQSLVLKLDQRNNSCSIDLPHPALPSDHLTLPKRIYAMIKKPGSYHHWLIEGELTERAQANDGPYFKCHINAMQYCDDRRRQKRFSFKENTAEICCEPAMEPPIYGDLDNISLGGICFNARGNLQQSDAFYRAQQGRKSAIPVTITLNDDDALKVELEILGMNVVKKPYLHTRVRAKFKQLSSAQAHILAALTQKSAEMA